MTRPIYICGDYKIGSLSKDKFEDIEILSWKCIFAFRQSFSTLPSSAASKIRNNSCGSKLVETVWRLQRKN